MPSHESWCEQTGSKPVHTLAATAAINCQLLSTLTWTHVTGRLYVASLLACERVTWQVQISIGGGSGEHRAEQRGLGSRVMFEVQWCWQLLAPLPPDWCWSKHAAHCQNHVNNFIPQLLSSLSVYVEAGGWFKADVLCYFYANQHKMLVTSFGWKKQRTELSFNLHTPF